MISRACGNPAMEDSDQAAHLHSLIRVFHGHSMGSKGSKVSSDEN